MIFIGGRSGVGKSAVAFEMHRLLSERGIRHAVIEGDCLDLAYPAPWEHHLAERNLAAMWGNYRQLGYRRLIYTNTVAVLEQASLIAAMGDSPVATSVLLRANDATAVQRLAARERGESLRQHIEHSSAAATRLDDHAGNDVHRVDTDDRSPALVADRIIKLSGWAAVVG